jgi:crotonobetainyl-CoA:carnitine CoA-transferase CaiB-like acyl-CoA transferase
MKRPFEGLKVIDATHVLAGPYCGYQLALLGAEVIKIESPDWPDPTRERGPVPELNEARMGINYLVQNGNKKAMTLNLKNVEGKEIFLKLAAGADVVIENFRSGAFGALGLGYDDIRKVNPRIVYCSITAFGQQGPWSTRNAYDPAIQGLSGIMMKTAAGGEKPVMPGAPFIDYATGLNAAFAVASALFHREKTGEGQYIDCAMLDTALIMTGPALPADNYVGTKKPTPREAGTDCYLTKNGYLQLGAYNVKQNNRLWKLLGRPEFASFTGWKDIWDNASKMREVLTEIMMTRTAGEWEELLAGASVPAARVRTLEEASHLPQLKARGFMSELKLKHAPSEVRVPVAAFSYRDGGPRLTSPPPAFGEHTDEILASLSYDKAEIELLRKKNVV